MTAPLDTPRTSGDAGHATLACFGITLFAGATLLFCVEPMVAKMLTPLLGGAPAVWITCMLFFQAGLLLAYAYAHASTAWLGPRLGAALHLVVLALPLLSLPVRIDHDEVAMLARGAVPVVRLLLVLGAVVGLPFFVVGTTSPLLQQWFSRTGHEHQDDPYFLYGASNLGSMVGLAAYPAIIEPWLGLADQARLWKWAYVGLAVLVAGCAAITFAQGRSRDAEPAPAPVVDAERVTWLRRARWVLAAFVPSSFLLGVTTYITTDVAGIPLFWVLPLAIYLASFILVFARRPPLSQRFVVRVLPFGLTATVMLVVVQASTPILLIVAVHLGTLFFASMACHGELARDRPRTTHLTEFYFWVSVGGVVGGIANGLVAPYVFDRIVEYPLAMVLAALVGRAAPVGQVLTRRDGLFALAMGALTFALVFLGKSLHLDPAGPVTALLYAPPLLLTYSQLELPRRFALGLAGTLVAGTLYTPITGATIHAERNFFGVVRVVRDPSGAFVQIVDGNTVHGRQRTDPLHKDDPAGYYTRIGPLGQVFAELHARRSADAPGSRVAVIGLGAGGMASYADRADTWTYYEINPAVVRVATDPRFFTFLRDAFPDPSRLSIVLGDARLRLADAPDASYDLLVVDAFSSDAIPAHLLTREALALYRRKLAPRGLLVVHISNRYLNLAPVLANLATDAGLTGYLRRDDATTDAAAATLGWSASHWALLVPKDDAAPVVAGDARWERFPVRARPPWTDDFSDLIRAYKWH